MLCVCVWGGGVGPSKGGRGQGLLTDQANNVSVVLAVCLLVCVCVGGGGCEHRGCIYTTTRMLC